MKDSTQEIDKILETIREYRRFVLTSHINPDGDGLGSELALYHFLNNQQKEVIVLNDSPVPATFRFMDLEENIFKRYGSEYKEDIIKADVIFILDISELSRLGALRGAIEESPAKRICIDHHVSNNFPGDILYADEAAAATGEMIKRLIDRSDEKLTVEMAEALYIALLSDTGCFRFSNTNARAHQLGADLLKAGANHQRIFHYLYENNSWEKTRLYSQALSTLKQEADGKIATMIITRDMLKQSGAAYEDIEGFSDFARNIKGVLLSILFVELKNTNIKISFRSGSDVLVNKLAGELGGGGHKNASASVIKDLSLDETIRKVLNIAITYVKVSNYNQL